VRSLTGGDERITGPPVLFRLSRKKKKEDVLARREKNPVDAGERGPMLRSSGGDRSEAELLFVAKGKKDAALKGCGEKKIFQKKKGQRSRF